MNAAARVWIAVAVTVVAQADVAAQDMAEGSRSAGITPSHHTGPVASPPAVAPAPRVAEDAIVDRSPYRLSWQREGVIFGVAGVAALVASAVTSEHDALTPEQMAGFDRASVPWFDRSATRRYSPDLIDLSEQIGSPLMFAPFALLIDSRIRSDWRSLGVMYFQTMLLASATSTIAKETISRYRPYVYNSDLSFEERTAREPGKAFFSSAATASFAQAVLLATVFSDHHPDSALKPYVFGASLAAAGAVGYLRYASGIHYPSDVLVGALVGSAIGWGVPRLHRTARDDLSITPVLGEALGLSVRITF